MFIYMAICTPIFALLKSVHNIGTLSWYEIMLSEHVQGKWLDGVEQNVIAWTSILYTISKTRSGLQDAARIRES
jgi:hypothetical protein